MFRFYNPNPTAARVGDCAVRAIAKATNQSWERAYLDLAIYGLMTGDMPSANAVWGRYLSDNGFRRYLSDDGETVKEFTRNHSGGPYVLALTGHTLCTENGDYFDSWDSGDEIILYYWKKEGQKDV